MLYLLILTLQTWGFIVAPCTNEETESRGHLLKVPELVEAEPGFELESVQFRS